MQHWELRLVSLLASISRSTGKWRELTRVSMSLPVNLEHSAVLDQVNSTTNDFLPFKSSLGY